MVWNSLRLWRANCKTAYSAVHIDHQQQWTFESPTSFCPLHWATGIRGSTKWPSFPVVNPSPSLFTKQVWPYCSGSTSVPLSMWLLAACHLHTPSAVTPLDPHPAPDIPWALKAPITSASHLNIPPKCLSDSRHHICWYLSPSLHPGFSSANLLPALQQEPEHQS